MPLPTLRTRSPLVRTHSFRLSAMCSSSLLLNVHVSRHGLQLCMLFENDDSGNLLLCNLR